MSMEIPLTSMKTGMEAPIVRLQGGINFQRKLRTMGIRENKNVKIVTKHPFGGPIVVEVDGRKTTIGRGMAQRVLVEVEK